MPLPAADLLPNLMILSQKLKADSKEDALSVLKAVLCINPDYADAYDCIGYIDAELSRWESARHHLEYSLSLKEGNAQIFFTLGNVCMSSGDCAAAVKYYEKSLAFQRFPEGLLNLSVAYTKLGDEQSRLRSLEALVNEFSDYAQGFNNLGVYWYRTRNLPQAIECFRKALELNPELSVARYGLSHALLMEKDYLGGFENQESRWGNIPNCPIRVLEPQLWTGQEVPNQSRILVTLEQGFGDTLQMLRFLLMLHSRFSEVSIEVQPAMCRLISKAFPSVHVLVHGEPLPTTDFYCPVMTLPWAFRIGYETIPVEPNGYIKIKDTVPISPINIKPGLKRAGLCWRGGAINPEMLHRSLALEDFRSLFDLAGYEWISLVKEVTQAELELIDQIENLTDSSTLMTDFYDTYSLIAGLDFVVSIDTAVAHLAAAMGKKTIVILNDGVDWRWHLDDDYSAWYPNARLLRSYNFSTQTEFMAALCVEILRLKR